MKNKLLKLAPIIILCIIVVIYISISKFNNKFNSDFASTILLTYKYDSNNISETLTDNAVIDNFKSVLKGSTFYDNPSCGFSKDISITLSNSSKTITLCPALDGCSTIKIHTSNKYFALSDDDIQKLHNLLSIYNFNFPSI